MSPRPSARSSAASKTRSAPSSPIGATRYFVEGVWAVGDTVALAPDDARKAVVVLRGRSGDVLEIVDSSGRGFDGRLHTDGTGAHVQLVAERGTAAPPSLAITLAQGLPKGSKMDLVIEKGTELGVAAFLPFASVRTVGDLDRGGKVERWRRIARSASQQCGRRDVPAVEEPVPFARVVERCGRFDVALVPWEVASPAPLRDRLPALLAGARTALVVIGPEGGLAHDEAAAAQAAGAALVSLGSRILRTETAGLATLAAMLYATGDL